MLMVQNVELDWTKDFNVWFPKAVIVSPSDHVYVFPSNHRLGKTIESTINAYVKKSLPDYKHIPGIRYTSYSDMYSDVSIMNRKEGVFLYATDWLGETREMQTTVFRIRLELPIFTAKEHHYMLWSYLAKTGVGKDEYCNFKELNGFITTPMAKCFACEQAYASKTSVLNHICLTCPLEWVKGEVGKCGDGLFGEWSITYAHEKRVKLARQIANLKRVKSWA